MMRHKKIIVFAFTIFRILYLLLLLSWFCRWYGAATYIVMGITTDYWLNFMTKIWFFFPILSLSFDFIFNMLNGLRKYTERNKPKNETEKRKKKTHKLNLSLSPARRVLFRFYFLFKKKFYCIFLLWVCVVAGL